MIYSPAAARGRRLALALCSGLALTMAGCDQDNAAATAVRDAEARINALTPAGSQPVSVAYRQKTYTDIRTKLQAISGGTASDKAAAQILLAQSNAGLAQIPAAEASALFEESLHEQVQARSVLGRWLTSMSLADAATRFDPVKPTADLDAEIAKVDQALAAAQQQKSQIDQKVSQLQAGAKEQTDQAAALRQQAATIRAKIPNESAVNGSELLKQAREIGRQADGLEVKGAGLDAEAQQVAPKSAEVQLDIDKLNLQKQLLTEGKAGIQKRADDARSQAALSLKEAADIAKDLDRLVQSLMTRQEEIKSKTEAAVAGYAAAEKAAKASLTELKGTASITLGSVLQCSGDASWTLAQSYQTLADTLEAIAKAPTAAPPNGPDLTAKAAACREAAKAALDAATEAYGKDDNSGALGAYLKAGAKAQAAQVMEKLTGGLKRSVKVTSGGSVDLGAPEKAPEPEKPADEGGAPTAAATPASAPDAGSPQATLQALIDASKAEQFDKVAALFAADTPEQKTAMASLFALAPKFKALNEAMKAKFGSGMEGMAGGGMGAPEVGDLNNLNVAEIKVDVEGDTATAHIPGGKDMAMKKVGGKWLIDLSSMGGTPEQMAMAGAMAPAIGKAVDEMVADINSGKITSAQAAQAAFMGKMTKAAMPKGGPAGGG